jgi:transposase
MMIKREGHRLPEWIDAVPASDHPNLRRFARGPRKDLDAVTAGLTLSHSSGAVEGNVNRLKMIKRKLYGRANLDLLRNS